MGTDDDSLKTEEGRWAYVIKSLFDVRVLLLVLGIIQIIISTCNHKETNDKQDKVAAKQDTIQVKQAKIDSTTTIQSKGMSRRDSANKIINAKLDLILHNDSLRSHTIKQKTQ